MARNIFKRFKRRAAQFEATRGRPIAPSVTSRFLEAEIAAEQERAGVEAERGERIRLGRVAEERGAAEIEAQRKAAIVSGVTGTAITAAIVGETKLGQAAGRGIARAAKGAVARVAPSLISAPAVGAETLTGAPLATAAEGTFAGAAAAEATPLATAAPVTPIAAPLVAGFVGAEVGKRVFGGEKGLIGKGETTQTIGTIGSAAAMGFLFGGPVGALIGAGTGIVSDATVICTELARQGYLDRRVSELDGEYRKKFIDDTTYNGYMMWAPYVVKAMKKSWIITQIVRPFGVGWAHHMAHKLDPSIKGSWIGWALLKVGAPLCCLLGRI